MLAYELAEPIANCATAEVSVAISRLRTSLAGRSDLLDRADADSIRFAQCTIYCASFRDTHLGTINEWRDVRRIGVAIAHKPFARRGFVDRCFERPSVYRCVTELVYRPDADSSASVIRVVSVYR
jgi:hypothetical protein